MNSMVLAGVGFGLCAAVAQTLSYLASRHFLLRSRASANRLWVVSHGIMGVWSLALLPLLWSPQVAPAREWLWPLAGTSGFYLIGQATLFRVLQAEPSSRVAPLLGTKIIVLAVITAFALHTPLTGWQWAAAAMSVAAAWLLNEAGGRLRGATAGLMAITVLAYCLSDLSIRVLVERVGLPGARGPLLGLCLAYVTCGVVALPFAFGRQYRSLAVWTGGVPYALAWFVAMGFLFACFSAVGVVFGNILQSTRGLFAIVLGAALAHRGLTHLEAQVTHGVFWKRAVGAVLMSAAIAVYVLQAAKGR